jgi:hypothetical protein
VTKRTKKSASVDRAFGEDSRFELLQEYFSGGPEVLPANAWIHVYKLLLWTDRTTGLAHCYESDKAQPGRPWYARSLAFHDWLATAMGVPPHQVGTDIDWLFRRCTERLVVIAAKHQMRRAPLAEAQRKAYQGRDLPQPGEDPVFDAMIREELGGWLSSDPPPDAFRRLGQRIQTYFGLENKRKNLVGEGFEDVLAAIVRRLPGSSSLPVFSRPVLHTLPGFRPPPGVEKPRKVDLAVVRPDQTRILVSAKWSVRADREEQFGVDFDAYARLEDLGRDFDFVLVTNEFDAARLAAACDRRRQNAFLFNAVVHVNPAGPIAAYGSTGRGSASRLPEHIESGRLISLEQWLQRLITGS